MLRHGDTLGCSLKNERASRSLTKTGFRGPPFSYIFLLFYVFFRLVSGGLREVFWGHFGSHFALIFHVFFDQKMHRCLHRFREAFWRVSGRPDPRKLSSRVHETLILTKSAFSFQRRFLMQNGTQKSPKMEPKSN